MQGMDLPAYMYEMYERIQSPRNFRAALAADEWLLSIHKHNQARTSVVKAPDLCSFSMSGKLKCMRSLEEGSMEKKRKQKRSL